MHGMQRMPAHFFRSEFVSIENKRSEIQLPKLKVASSSSSPAPISVPAIRHQVLYCPPTSSKNESDGIPCPECPTNSRKNAMVEAARAGHD
jgi:hypothetical protein